MTLLLVLLVLGVIVPGLVLLCGSLRDAFGAGR